MSGRKRACADWVDLQSSLIVIGPPTAAVAKQKSLVLTERASNNVRFNVGSFFRVAGRVWGRRDSGGLGGLEGAVGWPIAG